MLRLDIKIQHATKIPLLGVKNEPSPYIIMECEQISFASPIAKYSQNPIWNYHAIIEAKKATSYIHFYIYNNNPNAVDELLAYAKIEFGQLLTRTNSQYRLRLMNSLEQSINSFLFIEHYDANPTDLYLPLGERSAVMLRLINDLPHGHYFTCVYGDSSFNLSSELNQNAFRYNPKFDRIQCILRDQNDGLEMQNQLLIGNIGLNNCMSLRFYGPRQDLVIYLATSVIINGLLPQNYNILYAKIIEISKSNGKKNTNYKIKLYGPLNQSTFNEKAECQLYIQNNTQVLVEYFEDTDTIDDLEPYCSFRVPMNSLNWSNQTLECTHQLKYYDAFKSIETTIIFKLAVKKSFELSKIIPKLNNTEVSFDIDSVLMLEQIKLQNCYLFEVIKNNMVQLFHTDMRGVVTSFNKFTIIDNKTEYTILTRESLKEGGRGTLYLINIDQQFTEKQGKTIENSLIFKIDIQQPNKIEQSKIDFSSKFLAYAKKASVVNICKKFNQMVHDDLLKLKVKSKYTGIDRKGIIKILNMKALGPFGKINVQLGVDSVYRHSVGQVSNYLMEKAHKFYVSDGSIKVKAKLEGVDAAVINKDPNMKKEDYQVCFYGSFCDFFGTPIANKIYSQELKISPAHKLQIVYAFEQGQKLVEIPFKKTSDLQFLQAKSSVSLKLKRAFVGVNGKSYKFRISRGGYVYESQSYRCSNNKIYFQSSQRMILRMEPGQEFNPIFISSYSHDEQDNLLIYNGFINVSDIMGKGQYEVILVYEKQEKRKEISFIFQVLNSSPFLSGQNAGILKLSKISSNTSAAIFKNIYKHYLLVKINNFQYDIYECGMNEQSVTVNGSINLRKSDVLIFELYSSYKAISKQLFNSTEKQLVASGHAIWEEMQQNGSLILNYYPKKEGQLKFTKNSLAVQESSYKFHLAYTVQKANIQSRIEGLKLKPAYTEIDVLNRGVIGLYLKDLYPIEIQSKIISIQMKALNIQLSCQSNYKINKSYLLKAENMQFQLQASITMKEGEKYKRILSISTVKLRGNHYKINQNTSIIMHFSPYFYITANFIIFHNKFVSIPQGDLIIRQISTRGVKIDRFDLAFSPEPDYDTKENDKIYKKEGTEAKSCDLSLKTTSQMNSLLFNFQGKGFKSKSLICLSQLNIDRYDEEFTFEKQILVGGQSLILTLKVSYKCMKQSKQQEMSIKYSLNNSKDVIVAYNPDHYNTLTTNKSKSQTPKKSQGFFIQILIPTELADNTKLLHIITEGSESIVLTPSVSKNNQYVFYSNKYLQANTIKLINREYIDRPVEALGKQQGLWKFMIDQNPKLICTFAQNPCSISNIGNENWTFRFNFHRLLALSKKRLLCLKNTPNDDILTKQLALLVKHGSQYHFIRNLDEFGNNKTSENLSIEFGYDNNCNILQAFLVVDNYFNSRHYQHFQKLSINWMELFPISYGVVNISNITPELPFGFKVSPLENHSINLENAINRLIIREEDIFCLCDVSFTKKNWGFITIKLKDCTALNFTSKKQEQIYIYYKIQVQDSNRNIISGLTTEARPVGKSESIDFTNNTLHMLFIQENIDSHYNLKISGFILDNSNHYAFIEKRQEITDYFQRRGKQQINIQVKANETNNLCKNTFQIGLQLWNSIKPFQKFNLVERAKSINTVDALSFRELDNIQLFERLLGCQQLSHFNECLQEIKESFIYVQNPQYSSFILLIEYLSFNFDPQLIAQICQIIHLNLLKCPQIISDLEDSRTTKVMYDYFKLICLRERRKVPSKVTKVTNQEYLAALAKFKEKKDLITLKETLQLQMYILYTPDQLLASLSANNNKVVLNIINLLLKHSKIIKDYLSSEMEQWIEMFGFTPNDDEFQLFVLVLKNSLIYGSQLNQTNIHRFIEILMQRTFGLSMIFQFWEQLKDTNQKVVIYQSVLQKYQKQFQTNSVETCRGLKMMLSAIIAQKHSQLLERLEKAHQLIIKILIENGTNTIDIVVLSSHFDLLAFLLDQKLINEGQKVEIGALIKTKMESLKDSSTKLILNNYLSKFNRGKAIKIITNTGRKDGLGQQMTNKAGFYKKYLITSD